MKKILVFIKFIPSISKIFEDLLLLLAVIYLSLFYKCLQIEYTKFQGQVFILEDGSSHSKAGTC
jgi:hypothetical protein